ncbi:hypothetical protein P154DRAFT_392315, partial [Amniculicola lignicola CBS 123094]
MGPRKRARDEMEAEQQPVHEEPGMLHTLRNMWQFANLAQYLALFADVLKVDRDLDIEDLENECLRPQPSEKLAQIGLALLKHVSSHKGLTPEIFDEYTRRQFVAKAPKRNPFGTDEIPNKFDDFDVFTKIRVLQQLSVWTLNNPNTIRERMNATDGEQTLWRMEPLGWDIQERSLFVLDDNRLYRQTEPPPPAPPAKTKAKAKSKKSRSTRTSKRRKISSPSQSEEPEEVGDDAAEDAAGQTNVAVEDDGFGGMKWECLCITLEDYEAYMSGIKRSRDANEKALYQRLEDEVLPDIRGAAEERAKKEARRLRELETEQKLLHAKRSSRISARQQKHQKEEEKAEAERKRQADLAMARAEEEKATQQEQARESRMMTREQRLKEREAKRILHEEELRRLKEDSEKLGSSDMNRGQRYLKAEMKRREEELQKLTAEDPWVFDCEICHLYGENLDDGSHSIACDKCSVWQHSSCHKITKKEAERDDFEFVCKTCQRKEKDANQPKQFLKIRNTSTSSASAPAPPQANGTASSLPRQLDAVQIPIPQPTSQPTFQPIFQSPTRPTQSLMNGPSLSPRGQSLGPPGIHGSEVVYRSPLAHANGSSPPIPSRPLSSGQLAFPPIANGLPTSSPPRFQAPRAPLSPQTSFQAPNLQQNGSPYNASTPFRTAPLPPPYNNSFDSNHPASSASLSGSPVKHSPAPSPRPANGVPNTYNFNSPHSSFPPNSTQRLSFSPTKHSSPPPHSYLSSPAQAPATIHHTPSHQSQIPTAQMLPLPNPIPAPEKHDGARPFSSHSVSETPIFPPIKSLSPMAKEQNLSPPVKKTSPTPERQSFASLGRNGHGNGN